MLDNRLLSGIIIMGLALMPILYSCGESGRHQTKTRVPAGYYNILEIRSEGRMYRFGPFIGYYFQPYDPDDLARLRFLCFNEEKFYTLDLPENALLFTGEARLTTLPQTDFTIPVDNSRIVPVFADAIPAQWRATRPEPADAYRHFHSCHDDTGATLLGYWLLHRGVAEFTYDMGGRVGAGSPLYHEVSTGIDLRFAEIVEFDHGLHPPPR